MKLVDVDKLLPEDIPSGEPVLWQGRPNWLSLARRAFRLDLVGVYFVLLSAWAFLETTLETGVSDGLVAGLRVFGLGLLACGLLLALAWLSARTTLYLLTSRRVVMRIGIALPIFYNLPFATIRSADLLDHGDGTGDIPVSLTAGRSIGYLHLWPHARPFCYSAPQPTLRCIPLVADVAGMLATALRAAHERSNATPEIIRHEAPSIGGASTAAA